MSQKVGPLLWISECEVRKALTWDVLVPAMRDTLAAFCKQGLVEQPLRVRIHDEENNGFKLVMPGLVRPNAALATKILTMYPNNAAIGLPSHNAIIVLFDSHTGLPAAIVDGTSVTELRTAAASAAATLAIRKARGDSEKCEVVAVIGAGVQGAAHARVMHHVLRPTEIRVWSRGGGEQLTHALLSEGLPAVAADSLPAALQGADVITTCTFKLDDLIQEDWVKPEAIINAVGAANKGQRELSTQLLMSAAVYADSAEAAQVEAGDVVQTGVEVVGEVGKIISGELQVPRGKVIIFKSLGLAAEDAVAAKLVFDRLNTAT
ncbi:Ornithine cyclodeaminase/mu-crystallin [Trinorchestia longiramus]|nr:Ornithine cyclodeaminase/mu-crystallin [Trinorchestia longiramus]